MRSDVAGEAAQRRPVVVLEPVPEVRDGADVVWRESLRSDDDLSPFSRGLGAGAPVRSAVDHGVGSEPAVVDVAEVA